jgi:site-specific DNA-adenine methylase
MHRAGAFLRAITTPDVEPVNERQMVLPHVPMDAASETPPPAQAPMALSSVTEVEKTIWGSPAGKKRLAARLVKLIPSHKTYVEPFAGSAAVFFEKPSSDTEVLSDADPEIASAFKALTTLTDRELAALKQKEWTGRKRIFRALKDAKPRSKIGKLYRFLYLSHFAYGALRGKSYNAHDEGVEARTIDRIEKHRDRLHGVKVRSGHYVDVVKEFDGKDTFFFLDPPYPGHNVEVGEDRFDEAEFRRVLDGIKGKFLITYGTRGQLDTTGFHVRKIRTRRSMAYMRGVGGSKTLPQLLIANYGIAQKALGPYELDEVEAAVELTSAAAADLDLARILAKALAQEADAPSIIALARELDRLDDASDERTAALARELLPIGDRLGPAIEASLPDLASVLHEAIPALEDLAKAHRGMANAHRSRGTGPAPSEASMPGDPAPASLTAILDKRIPLLKTDEERYVLGVVLEPETVDAQNDIYSVAEVREAAHRFMQEYQNVGLMHRDLVNGKVKILESYLAPAAFAMSGTQVRKGTWLLAVRVLDDGLWAQIKNGELTGLSIGGSAARYTEPRTGGAKGSA